MRTYSVTTSRVFCVLTFLSFLSSAALTGCLSSGATPPGANAPCKINDDCPSGYQCRAATNGALGGPFCCKDKNNCGPAGSGGSGGGSLDGGGSGIDGIAAMDGPSSKGGALDVASSGGAGGSVIVDGGSGGAGGGITVVGGSASGGGTAGGLATGGVAGNSPASGGVLAGGIASGGMVSGGGAGGALDAARDLPQIPDSAPDISIPDTATDSAPDLPLSPPDGNGTCPTGEKACTSASGTTCIATSACCTNADCAGTCQTCNTSHACVAAVSQDDPLHRHVRRYRRVQEQERPDLPDRSRRLRKWHDLLARWILLRHRLHGLVPGLRYPRVPRRLHACCLGKSSWQPNVMWNRRHLRWHLRGQSGRKLFVSDEELWHRTNLFGKQLHRSSCLLWRLLRDARGDGVCRRFCLCRECLQYYLPNQRRLPGPVLLLQQ